MNQINGEIKYSTEYRDYNNLLNETNLLYSSIQNKIFQTNQTANQVAAIQEDITNRNMEIETLKFRLQVMTKDLENRKFEITQVNIKLMNDQLDLQNCSLKYEVSRGRLSYLETKITPCQRGDSCYIKQCIYFHTKRQKLARKAHFDRLTAIEDEKHREEQMIIQEKLRKESELAAYANDKIFYRNRYLELGRSLKEIDLFADDISNIIREFCCTSGLFAPLNLKDLKSIDHKPIAALFYKNQSVRSVYLDKKIKRYICYFCDEKMGVPGSLLWWTHEFKTLDKNQQEPHYSTSGYFIHRKCLKNLGFFSESESSNYLYQDVIHKYHCSNKDDRRAIPSYRKGDTPDWTCCLTTSLYGIIENKFDWLKSDEEPENPGWLFPVY